MHRKTGIDTRALARNVWPETLSDAVRGPGRPGGARFGQQWVQCAGFLGGAWNVEASDSEFYAGPMTFDRITVDGDRMGGVPCIRTLRFPVASVVAMVADGMSDEEILAEHPDLEAADIREALRYASLAVLERELPLRRPA